MQRHQDLVCFGIFLDFGLQKKHPKFFNSSPQIPHLFTHFWHEIPPHIAGLLGQNVVVTLIGVCDAILYRTILKAILPTAVQVIKVPLYCILAFGKVV